MNEFYVTCVDPGIVPGLTVGKMYRVKDGFLYIDDIMPTAWNLCKINPMGLYVDINNVEDINDWCGPVLGARFIAAERICDIDE